jgi:hypothetical protein
LGLRNHIIRDAAADVKGFPREKRLFSGIFARERGDNPEKRGFHITTGSQEPETRTF